jgi:hypothetical protein
MATLRSWLGARLRFRRASSARALAPPPSPAPVAVLRAGLGEPPAAGAPEAAEAELDTLRGELVRELDRLAEGDDSSASFRRIAS